MGASLQIQTVLYKNDASAVVAALESLANALKVDEKSARHIDEVVMRYGDASDEPVFSVSDVEELSQRFSSVLTVDYVFFAENTGTAKGHNLLAEAATSDYLMVMNPDVLVSPNFFLEMFALYDERGASVGLVEARQTPIEHPKEYNVDTLETGWASTAAVIFPRSVYEEVGGFDAATFFMYCDDVDFSWRIRLAGYSVLYQPRAVVFHAKRLSRDALWQPTAAEVYYSAEAALLMSYKWSNGNLCEKLYKRFSQSENKDERRAAKAFEDMKSEGRLPRQLDPKREVGCFVDGGYTPHRFKM